MNHRHVLAVMRKEWLELIRTRTLLFTLAFVPGALVCLNAFVEYSISTVPANAFHVREGERLLTSLMARYPGINVREAAFVLLNEQSLSLLLVIAAALPASIASHAIVGEKVERTLEPLLATPIRTRDLLLAKCTIAVLPSLVMTWLAYGATVLCVAVIATPRVAMIALRPAWWLSYAILAPLLSLASSFAAVIASSRVSDARTAQGLTSFLLLPVVGIGVSTMMGFLYVDVRFVFIETFVLIAFDAMLLAIAVRLFRRESILTRWR